MEFYSTIRKNDTMQFEGKCKLIQIEKIILSEVRQAQKDKGYIFICFLLYVGGRDNTNISNIMKNRLH
jgi:hypothetical protein